MIAHWLLPRAAWHRPRRFAFAIAGAFLLLAGSLVALSLRLAPRADQRLKRLAIYEPASVKQLPRNFEAQVVFNEGDGGKPFTEMALTAIEQTQASIEIAMYSFNSPALREALYAATWRGVAVTVIADESKEPQHQQVFRDAPANFQLLQVGSRATEVGKAQLMHHKFALFDRGLPSQRMLTGSWNWTEWQEQYDPSFVISAVDPAVIEAYGEEFDRLRRGQFGVGKFTDSAYRPWARQLRYANGELELWWGPGFRENSIKQRLLDAIAAARQRVDVIIWQLTDSDIARALGQAAQRGVAVTIITEDSNVRSEDSAVPYLIRLRERQSELPLEVFDDAWRSIDLAGRLVEVRKQQPDFNPYLHQRTLIVDGALLITGTNNWSYLGSFRNDEAILATTIPTLIEPFQQSFQRHYQELRAEQLRVQR